MPTRRPHSRDPHKDARDQRIRDEGNAALADAERVARHVRDMLDRQARSVARFSIRNQMILAEQAAHRGITLTDVDTFHGWRRRGRRPAKAGDALFVTVPISVDARRSRPADNTEPGRRPVDDPSTDAPVHRFRMKPRWDISQTVPLSDAEHAEQADTASSGVPTGDQPSACTGCDAGPGAPCEPGCGCFGCAGTETEQSTAEILWNTFITDVTRAGYRTVFPAAAEDLHSAPVYVDHDTRTVFLALAAATDPYAYELFGVAAADILTRADQQQRPQRSARTAVAALDA